MLKRFSVLGSVLLAACVPFQRMAAPTPVSRVDTCNPVPFNLAEKLAWHAALKQNTSAAYRSFIKNHPRSCYVPMAKAKMSRAVVAKPVTMRNIPKAPRPKSPAPRRAAYP
ncbi:hypothetical protein [Mesorhizobium sp. DCY119]|jgi:hypothetical protein|uniref:hypothetical protein n=2 Tax=Mesorhizobium sp. DCY119 TaxID=2108445 RepID=UPI000E6BD7FD|nr:hypothetical protein [Mesorhizobium sp. DCY119]RJG45625.1 hypothetical protein D3Y55_16115 [Mesorhizobium sp. DCY119]